MSLPVVEKAYAYATRGSDPCDLLVFRHPDPEGGIQVPKGTVDEGERPREAVRRELREESGLSGFDVLERLATDTWDHPAKPKQYRRHFFRVEVGPTPERWHHTVTGGGEDDGMTYEYFWVDPGTITLAADMGDYLGRL